MSEIEYEVTYAFNGYLPTQNSDVFSLIDETVEALQQAGVDVEFRGATQEINAAGQLVEASARYRAPCKGTIGRLNCRARLPASGPPRRIQTTRESEAKRAAVASPSRAGL